MADKDSRPGGMIELSPAMERTLDKAAAGKIPAPPIEAFMSDSALQEAADATAASTGPVHAEDLVPISPDEAARRSTFDGNSLPKVTRRRVIPAPYRRERISGGRHGKTWQPVRADQVTRGDMTELVGVVASAETVVRREDIAGTAGVAVGTDVELTGIGGMTRTVDAAAAVRVFRAERSRS